MKILFTIINMMVIVFLFLLSSPNNCQTNNRSHNQPNRFTQYHHQPSIAVINSEHQWIQLNAPNRTLPIGNRLNLQSNDGANIATISPTKPPTSTVANGNNFTIILLFIIYLVFIYSNFRHAKITRRLCYIFINTSRFS